LFVSSSGSSDGECILVTGGAGFVGAELVADLARRGKVVIVDDLSVGRPMPPATPGLTCHRIDILDRDSLQGLFAQYRPACVVHLAAIHHIPTCERTPHHAMNVNVMGLQSVLDACRAVDCRRVILASSGAVYGWSDGPLAEDARLGPQDVYSASKAANEHQLAAWVSATGGVGLIARMFNVIGPDDPNGHLIPDLLERLGAAPAGIVTLRMGNIETRRDFVDVRDMAAGFVSLVTHSILASTGVHTFNLCSGTEHTIADTARLLALHMGIDVSIVSDPLLRRAIDRPSQRGDPTKSSTILKWQAVRTLDQSLAFIVESVRASQRGLAS